MEKSIEDERLIQFLMGLNDNYGQARGTILLMNPLPTINQAYSLVLQDESQKEAFADPLISTDSSSFMVTNQNNFAQRGMRQMQRTQMQYQKSANHKFGNQKATTQRNTTLKGRKAKFNPNATCSHCKKVGHTLNDCYRTIGFPEDFEFTRENQAQARSNGHSKLKEQNLMEPVTMKHSINTSHMISSLI